MRGDVAIRVEGLTKRFGELTALDGIGFEVPQATVFGLLGPNGAGKTTAVRILATVLQPDGGTAQILGHDVVHDPVGVRYLLGLAGQSAAVDPNLTGRENLDLIGRLSQLTRREASDRATRLLERFELTHAADRPVRTYSGGMRRRLDVAAALVADRRVPQLLVFSTIQPVIFVLMFRYIFGGAIRVPGFPYPYVDFLMPGIF